MQKIDLNSVVDIAFQHVTTNRPILSQRQAEWASRCVSPEYATVSVSSPCPTRSTRFGGLKNFPDRCR